MTDTALVGGICVDIRKSMSRFVDAYRIPLRMTDTALVGGICVDIRKSMSRFVDAYVLSILVVNTKKLLAASVVAR
ncbi:hypothetical protein GL180_16065 [Vibrio toranzoniae]|nr:hypothetical protein [Vibrio toranzoniae]